MAGKSLKLKMRCGFLNIKAQGLTNAERIVKIKAITQTSARLSFPQWLVKEGKLEAWKKWVVTHRQTYKAANRSFKVQQRLDAIDRKEAAAEVKNSEGFEKEMAKLDLTTKTKAA